MDFVGYLVLGLLLIVAMSYLLIGEYFEHHCSSESDCHLTKTTSYNPLD